MICATPPSELSLLRTWNILGQIDKLWSERYMTFFIATKASIYSLRTLTKYYDNEQVII